MRISTLVLSTLVAAIAASQALAASQIQTLNFGPQNPNFVNTLTFNQFNPALGTLNSIQVIMDVTSDGGSLTADNDGVGAATINVELGAEGNISSTDVTLLDLLFQPVVADVTASSSAGYNLAGNVGDGPNDYDGTAPDGVVHLGGVENDSDSGFINSTFFGPYTGLGTYDIDAEIDGIYDHGGVGGVEGAFTPLSAYGFVRVIYDYTPAVPEPATAVLALGMCVLPLVRRKR